MVFCGKPSKACEPCRSKRRKCDLAKPSCQQCLRAGVTCHGYRDIGMILFRDETATISRKAQDTTDRKLHTYRKSPSQYDEETLSMTSQGELAGPGKLLVDVDTVAVGYFLGLYAPDTSLSYLPRYWSDVSFDVTVKAAILPVSMAALAWNTRRPGLVQQARSSYSVALKVANLALSSPQSALMNTTLLSVLLLAMYEAIIFRGRSPPEGWALHINGLTTLLALRELEQVNELGLILNHHAANQILAQCSLAGIPVPQFRSGLNKQELQTINMQPLQAINTLLEGLALLGASMDGMMATDVVRECLRLEQIVNAAMTELYTSTPFTIVGTDFATTENQIGGAIHHYHSQNAARQWNNLRSLRIVLNEWIFCAFDPQLRGIVSNYPSPDDILFELWDELPKIALANFATTLQYILASIPYSRGDFDQSCGVSARFLLWPLSVAAASELCPAPAKNLIISILRDMANANGIEQAEKAARMLEENVSMEKWLHIYQFS